MGLFSFFARVLGCQMWIFTMLGAGCFYISISVLGACSEMQVVLLGDGFFPSSLALKKLGAHSKRWQFLLLKIDCFIMLSLIPVTLKQWGVFVEARGCSWSIWVGLASVLCICPHMCRALLHGANIFSDLCSFFSLLLLCSSAALIPKTFSFIS